MRAMVLTQVKKPLELRDVPKPTCGPNEILVKVSVCGVCRTDLHVADGELENPKLPLILGHQIVGIVEEVGTNTTGIKKGEKVGIPWLHGVCGYCEYCNSGQENLCAQALYTGYQVNGGYAEYCVADPQFTFPIPASYSDVQVAPLLCAGLVGFRAYRMLNTAKNIGFYGFGSSAHILTQIAVYEGRNVYAFTRPKDLKKQAFAKKIGAIWAGGSDEKPLIELDGAIIFGIDGELVPTALKAVKKGGTVVSADIYMTDIPSFSYKLLWGERVIRSVSNLTRKDGADFFSIAPKVPVETTVTTYTLEEANQALADLRSGKLVGSAVLVI